MYSEHHDIYHPYFSHFLNTRNYYDVFLFNNDGDLIYSVFKELDFATNLNTGKWKESDLGNAFRAAKNSPNKQQHFFDFKPYAPSHGAPASFLSQAIIDEKSNVVGVAIIQMPIDRINAIMLQSEGLGETGEAYIAGTDGLYRNDSKFTKENDILQNHVSQKLIDLALQNNDGVIESLDERTKKPYLKSYSVYEFMGTKWVMVSQEEKL